MPIVAANILRTVSSLTAPLYRVSRLCYHFSTLPNPVTDFVRVRIHDFNHLLLFLDGWCFFVPIHICNWEEEEETRILFGHRWSTSSFNCWQVSVDGFNINSLIYSFSLDSFLHGLEWNFRWFLFYPSFLKNCLKVRNSDVYLVKTIITILSIICPFFGRRKGGN